MPIENTALLQAVQVLTVTFVLGLEETHKRLHHHDIATWISMPVNVRYLPFSSSPFNCSPLVVLCFSLFDLCGSGSDSESSRGEKSLVKGPNNPLLRPLTSCACLFQFVLYPRPSGHCLSVSQALSNDETDRISPSSCSVAQ